MAKTKKLSDKFILTGFLVNVIIFLWIDYALITHAIRNDLTIQLISIVVVNVLCVLLFYYFVVKLKILDKDKDD